MYKHYKKQEGFTLVEVLIGLTIFMIAFLALIQVNTRSLEDINQTKRKLVAQYLAEEGIEYVKHIHKSYVLQSKTKADFITEFRDQYCQFGCDFFIGNTDTQNISVGDTVDDASYVTMQSHPLYNTGFGASYGQVGVVGFTDSDTWSPGDTYANAAKMKYYDQGLIAAGGTGDGTGTLYDMPIANSEFTRVVTINDIGGQDPNYSEALEVVSRVYIQTPTLYNTTSESIIEVSTIIHFNLP